MWNFHFSPLLSVASCFLPCPFQSCVLCPLFVTSLSSTGWFTDFARITSQCGFFMQMCLDNCVYKCFCAELSTGPVMGVGELRSGPKIHKERGPFFFFFFWMCLSEGSTLKTRLQTFFLCTRKSFLFIDCDCKTHTFLWGYCSLIYT